MKGEAEIPMLEKPLFIRKKEEELDEPGYVRFKEDWEILSSTIVALAQELYAKEGCQYICYKSSTDLVVNFCVFNSLEQYFQKCLLIKKHQWMTTLKKYTGESWESFDQYNSAHDQEARDRIKKIFDLSTWNSCKGIIFEWAILASLLYGLRKMIRSNSTGITLGPNETPVLVDIKGHNRYIWYQKSLIAEFSGMKAVPDILITKDDLDPSRSNVTGIIECKNVKSIGTKVVREEYGKSYDIGPDYIILCSYAELSPNIKQGAKRLGLHVLENPISTNRREAIISKKVLFQESIIDEVLKADEQKLFRQMELSKRDELDRKRILSDAT